MAVECAYIPCPSYAMHNAMILCIVRTEKYVQETHLLAYGPHQQVCNAIICRNQVFGVPLENAEIEINPSCPASSLCHFVPVLLSTQE